MKAIFRKPLVLPPGEIGPKRLQWLRQNVPSFAETEAKVKLARHGSTTPRRGNAETKTANNGDPE